MYSISNKKTQLLETAGPKQMIKKDYKGWKNNLSKS